jgi:hypothetical protein
LIRVAFGYEFTMDKLVILGFVRHLLTFGGGFLVAEGSLSQPELQEAVGALAALAGVVWSIWEKRRRK